MDGRVSYSAQMPICKGAARMRRKRGWQAADYPFDGESICVQHFCNPCARALLLEAQFGRCMNAMTQLEQPVLNVL